MKKKKDKFDEDKFIKDEVEKAVSNMEAEMEIERQIRSVVRFCKERRFNLYHPDVSPELREYLFNIMDNWPRVSFVEHCMISNFFRITESPDVTYEINPQKESEVPEGDTNLLDEVDNDNMIYGISFRNIPAWRVPFDSSSLRKGDLIINDEGFTLLWIGDAYVVPTNDPKKGITYEQLNSNWRLW